MKVQSGTETRRATGLVRMHQSTLEKLRGLAERRGSTMLDILDDIVVKEAKIDAVGKCRFCSRVITRCRKKHNAHARDCVLWKDRCPPHIDP